ncbi:MAG TPA: Hpt domain-containing protein, partial [Leptolyngbyaceae cyanobacterium]
MQPEQQQRIMGYFIEEAKDHLNTIEQGLLNLQSTMEDTEMVNEVFRAAHSVKGGAAMLGLNSIQKTAHRLEDCFKVLKESPVKADNQLESLFLRVFDTLQALVEQLQGPFGLTDDTASGIMLDAEPVFEALNTHLKELLKGSGNSTVIITEAPKAVDHRGLISAVAPSELEAPLSVNGQLNGENTKAMPVTFKRDVLVGLREMLQLFKQEDSPENREALQEHCQSLALLGEQLDLPGWGELLETSRAAIAFPQNSYRLLASLIIKEIKQAQELVLVNRSVEIVPSEQLKALVPKIPHSELEVASDAQEQENFLRSDTNFKTEAKEPETAQPKVNTTAENHSSTTHLFNSNKDTYILEDISEAWKEEDFTQYNTAEIPSHQTSYQGYSRATTGSRSAEPSDPEVGMAELNSLADIFEGQTPDLDQTWQEEEIIRLNERQWAEDPGNPFSMDDQSDFSDLLGDTDDFDISAAELSTGDDFMGWLGEDSTEEVPLQLQESIHSFLGDRLSETTPSTTESDNSSSWDATLSDFANEADALGMPPGSDFSDLLFESDSSDPITVQAANADELKSLFGDNFFEDEENTSVDENTADFVFDADAMPEAQQQDEDFFDMSAEEENDSLGFEDPFAPVLDDLDSDESQHEEAAIAESEFDFDDLLEIAESASPAASQEQGVANLEESFSFDEFVLDESVADFDFAAGEELTQSSWEFDSEASSAVQMSESADWSVDDSWLDASTHVTSETEISPDSGLEDFFSTDELNDSEALAWQQEDENALNDLDIEEASTYATGETAISIDTGLEDFFSTDELNDSEALAWQQEDENALEASAIEDGSTTVTSETAIPIDTGLEDFFSTDELNDSEALAWQQEDENALNALDIDLEWDDTDTTVIQMTGIDLEWDDMDATVIQSTETETGSEAIDSEAWLSDTAQTSGFDFDIDATSTSPFNFDFDEERNGDMDDLFENESSSLVEASQNDAFNDSEDFDDLLGQQTADTEEALAVEGLGLELIEELEATPNIEGLDDFLDVADVTDTSVEDNSLDFDDFSIFEQSAAVDNGEAVQDTFEEQLLDTSTDDYSEIFSVAAASELEAESLADNSESLFDTDDDALFEREAETAQNVAADNLEALFGDETSEDTDALNLPSVEMEALNFEEDLFGGEASSQGWDLQPEAEATAEATAQPEAAIFDWEAQTTPQTAADTRGWDLDELWSEETSEEADAWNLPSVEMEALNFEEDLFGGEASSQGWDLQPEAEATAEATALNFEEDLFGGEASSQEWDLQPEAEATAEATTQPEAQTTAQTAADTPGWDLDDLWNDETSGDADALNLPSVEMEALNFEEDLFGGEASSQGWDLQPEAEATAEATAQPEAAIFDWEAETTPQTATDTPGWDLDELWSDETSEEADALNLPSVEMEALNFEEDLFGDEASSQE